LLAALHGCWLGWGSNKIWEWQSVVVGLELGFQLWNQTQSSLGLVSLVQATKQGALHRVSQAVAGLGLAAFRQRSKHALCKQRRPAAGSVGAQ